MNGRVIVVGSINTDLVVATPRFPLPGETLTGSSFTVSGGGKGANQAIAAARLGGVVRFIGAVGDDAYGEARLAALMSDGIDVSHVRRMPEAPSGVALILVDGEGHNSIVVIAGANGTVAPEYLDEVLVGTVQPEDVLCCQLEIPFEATRRALEIGKREGATTVLNAAPGTGEARDLLPLVDVLVVNEIEAMQLAGRESQPANVSLFDVVGESIRSYGAGEVVVTLGELGAIYRGEAGGHYFPAVPVEAVDTTGAGDAFVGVLVALLAEGWGTLEAVPICIRAGSLAVTRASAQPSLPHRHEILRAGEGL